MRCGVKAPTAAFITQDAATTQQHRGEERGEVNEARALELFMIDFILAQEQKK